MTQTRAVEPWTLEPLQRFVAESAARLALLTTTSGQVIAQHGFTRAVDVMSAAALGAEIAASTSEIIRMLQEPAFRVLAGGLRAQGGPDVAEEVAAYLAGVSQEAERSARLLDLGEWRWIMAEGEHGHLHLSAPSPSALLLLARDKSIPSGRLAILAARAAEMARRWLEAQTL